MAEQAKDVSLTIDGVVVTVPAGTLLVEAAKDIRRDVPVYCYHPKLGPAGLCRICLVEIEKTPKLQIACNTVVTEGMVVHTLSEKALEGRRAVLEFLLLNHPLDCPICDKGGECDLQDFVMAYGQGASRLADAKVPKPKAVDLGPTIVLDEERCILCLRCVRFDDLITGERSLRTEDRGAHALIATATGEPYRSDFSGNVTELCPVGALTSKTYRFRARPWDLHRTPTACVQCSVGCRLSVDQRHGSILRTMSDPSDDAISDGWLCDRGRYNIGFYADERRITSPLVRSGSEWVQTSWDEAIALWAASLKETIAEHGPQAVAALGGGRLLNEEAYLLQHVYRLLGVANVDWRVGRQRYAIPPGPGSLAALERAQAIVVCGRSPAQLAPVLDLRIRKAVARDGATLIALGPLAGSEVLPHVRAATLDDVRAALPEKYERIAIVWDGVPGPFDDDLAAFREAQLAGGKDVATFVVGEQPNARGAAALGLVPGEGGRDTRGILEAARDGALRSLAIFGANPMLRYPDRGLVSTALERVGFLVVSELFMTETAERAHLILPARGAFEKTGTTTNVAGDVLDVRAAVQAPAGTLSDGEMLVVLADALGLALPDAVTIRTAIDAAIARGAAEPRAPAVAPRAGEGLRLRHADAIFTGGGTAEFDARIVALRPLAQAFVAPGEGSLEDGDVVDLVAADGTQLAGLVVRTSPAVGPGDVHVLDGIPGAPGNVLAEGSVVTVANLRKMREAIEA